MIVILHITHLLDHDLLHLVAELIGLLSAALFWPISTDKPLLHVTLSGSSAPLQRELDKSLLMGNSYIKTPVVGPSMRTRFWSMTLTVAKRQFYETCQYNFSYLFTNFERHFF
jgi:hypothetical protein